jgi:hypothetical protein
MGSSVFLGAAILGDRKQATFFFSQGLYTLCQRHTIIYRAVAGD